MDCNTLAGFLLGAGAALAGIIVGYGYAKMAESVSVRIARKITGDNNDNN